MSLGPVFTVAIQLYRGSGNPEGSAIQGPDPAVQGLRDRPGSAIQG